ncbi:hypothetical protein [Devosia submarina]|uniref:hypothetical protein n=1 Tax=Devosia submarina TaxID=1173082 RepID=UPI000D3B7BC0|nr:hypothetical protein [Devosia submarina]
MERTLANRAPTGWLNRSFEALEHSSGRALFFLGLALALLLAIPGETVTTRAIEELIAILDGVQRLQWGAVPNRDFHSAVGPLAYVIPALGYALTGSMGAAMPLGMALLLLPIALIAAYVLPSRLSPALALPFGVFLLLILAVPMNLGDGLNILSFGQFYNRIGWVGLSLLVVLFLPGAEGAKHSRFMDGLCATLLVLLLAYSRVTYGIAGLGFLLLMLTDRRQWRWAAAALVAVAICALLVEFVWGGSQAYWRDSMMSFAAAGWLRGTPAQWLELFLGNLADYLLLGLLAGISLWRRFSVRTLLFVVLCGLAGFWLINQNDQRWGMLTIHAAAAVLAEGILRDMRSGPGQPTGTLVNPAGIKLYLLGFLFPTILHCTIALSLHTGSALANAGESLPVARLEGVRVADLLTAGDFGGSRWYLGLVSDGVAALENLDGPAGKIVVLGGPNPFSLALDLEPAHGDVAHLRWGAHQNESVHTAPEQMFGDADIVMERTAAGGIGGLGQVYMPFVLENFELVAQTANWRIFQRPADAQ